MLKSLYILSVNGENSFKLLNLRNFLFWNQCAAIWRRKVRKSLKWPFSRGKWAESTTGAEYTPSGSEKTIYPGQKNVSVHDVTIQAPNKWNSDELDPETGRKTTENWEIWLFGAFWGFWGKHFTPKIKSSEDSIV